MLPLRWQFSPLDGKKDRSSPPPKQTNKQINTTSIQTCDYLKKKTCNIWVYIM